MDLPQRIDLLADLGEYMRSEDPSWQAVKQKAFEHNAWFLPEFLEGAIHRIAVQLLDKRKLEAWTSAYQLPANPENIKNVGVVMAGNIPLVGFHDFLCVFISGHRQTIKASSRDSLLITNLAGRLIAMAPSLENDLVFADMLKGCDAYIATGSNNSARYFDYYFSKYPHIIRRNRTSVGVLTGEETKAELEQLADDICLYFGLGCRNVTKLYVPEGYDFLPLLDACNKYAAFADNHKYKNNYDYQLALHILNKKYYMTNGSVILSENTGLFSPISVLHYEYYKPGTDVLQTLQGNPDLQCVAGSGQTPFGRLQLPELTDYADGVDTLRFLQEIGMIGRS